MITEDVLITEIDGCVFFSDHGLDDEWRNDPDQYWLMMEQVEAMKRGFVPAVCDCMKVWTREQAHFEGAFEWVW